MKILPQLFYQTPEVKKILVDGLSCVIFKEIRGFRSVRSDHRRDFRRQPRHQLIGPGLILFTRIFLPDDSTFVTGSEISVDGGKSKTF